MVVLEMSEIWYSSSTLNRAFIWYPWCWNRSIFEKKFLARSTYRYFIPMTQVPLLTKKMDFWNFGLWTLKMVLNGAQVPPEMDPKRKLQHSSFTMYIKLWYKEYHSQVSNKRAWPNKRVGWLFNNKYCIHNIKPFITITHSRFFA